MTYASRFAISRRDNNDEPLTKAARLMGCLLLKDPPLDYWFWWAGISTHWTPMDIKDPKREGHADEYTDDQREFIAQCKELGAHYEIWRTVEDIELSRRRARGRG